MPAAAETILRHASPFHYREEIGHAIPEEHQLPHLRRAPRPREALAATYALTATDPNSFASIASFHGGPPIAYCFFAAIRASLHRRLQRSANRDETATLRSLARVRRGSLNFLPEHPQPFFVIATGPIGRESFEQHVCPQRLSAPGPCGPALAESSLRPIGGLPML
jgi:hypothetical protein